MTDFFRVKESFQRQRVMHTLGMELLDVKAGECIIGFSYREDLTQQNGFIHAGVIATALDSACGYAAFSMMPEDADVLSIEFKTNLMRPACTSPQRRCVQRVSRVHLVSL